MNCTLLTFPAVVIQIITEESKCLYLNIPNCETINQAKIMALKTVAGHIQRNSSVALVCVAGRFENNSSCTAEAPAKVGAALEPTLVLKFLLKSFKRLCDKICR